MFLVLLHAVLSQVQVGGVLAEFLLVLWGLLQHLRQVADVGLLCSSHPLGFRKLLQLPGHLSGRQRREEIIIMIIITAVIIIIMAIMITKTKAITIKVIKTTKYY